MFLIDELFCKHIYRRIRPVEWPEPEYREGLRFKWMRRYCLKTRFSEGPMLDLRKRK